MYLLKEQDISLNKVAFALRLSRWQAARWTPLVRCLVAACLCVAAPAFHLAHAAEPVAGAKTQSPIVITLKQFKVTKETNGEAKFVDASIVVPGDVLEYRATYTNRGNVPLSVVANLPVPQSVEYVKDSAKAKSNIPHAVAQKDGQFTSEPIMKKTVSAAGATLYQPVPYATYRFVRWDLGSMAPGTSVEVSIRAKVSDSQEDATPN
jgi:uncharacterized repeat protein (TIGR01451 family)